MCQGQPDSNWHQLENLSPFVKVMVSHDMNSVELLEASSLFEWGHEAGAGVSWLWQGRTRQRAIEWPAIGLKYTEKQE